MKKKVFLFPLPNAVFMPVIRKPLRIFEPRYLEMIKTAHAENIPVALCLGMNEYSDHTVGIEHESLHYVKKVCGVGFVNILEQTDKGELMIVLEPLYKVEIESIISSGLSYNVASVKEIIEFESVLPQNFLILNQLKNHFLIWSKNYFKDPKELEEITKVTSDNLILIALLCEFTIYSAPIKQEILELDDINDKLLSLSHIIFSNH